MYLPSWKRKAKPIVKQPVMHTIKSLMIPEFIEVLKGDLSHLVIEGEPTQEELKAAWETIHSKYLELTADENLSHYLRETGRIEDLDGKIIRVNLYLTALAELYDEHKATSPAILEALAKEGYRVRFDKEDPEQYVKDLNLVPSLLKKQERNLKALMQKYEELLEKNKDASIEQTIGANIVTISKVMQMQISAARLSVWEYCMYLNRVRTEK